MISLQFRFDQDAAEHSQLNPRISRLARVAFYGGAHGHLSDFFSIQIQSPSVFQQVFRDAGAAPLGE